MSISMVNGLPDINSVQKRVYPLIFTAIVSEQPTTQPIATAYGLKAKSEADDGSGWDKYSFSIDRWYAEVENVKLKTEVSVEAIQDMMAIGIDPEFIVDNLADIVASRINQSIITNLNAISTLGTAVNIANAIGDYEKGREIYSAAHQKLAELEKDTGCVGTYIVAGGKAFELLLGCGHVSLSPEKNYHVCESGAILVHDHDATTDYFTVGVKKKIGDVELSSLVWSPYDYTGDSAALAYQVQTTISDSLIY